jgi:hypothetical protein
METKSPNHIFYEDESVIFEYEKQEKTVGLHCRVIKWNPQVLRKCYEVFGSFLEICSRTGVERVMSISPNPKFCSLFGAYEESSFVLGNKEYKVMVWDLK